MHGAKLAGWPADRLAGSSPAVLPAFTHPVSDSHLRPLKLLASFWHLCNASSAVDAGRELQKQKRVCPEDFQARNGENHEHGMSRPTVTPCCLFSGVLLSSSVHFSPPLYVQDASVTIHLPRHQPLNYVDCNPQSKH